MRDITILMDTTQGRPARLLEELTRLGVDVDAACLFPRTEGRVMHLAVEADQVDTARAVSTGQGAAVVDDRESVVVPAGFPGGVAGIATRVAAVGVTVNVVYFGRRGEVVLSTTDLDKARQALDL